MAVDNNELELTTTMNFTPSAAVMFFASHDGHCLFRCLSMVDTPASKVSLVRGSRCIVYIHGTPQRPPRTCSGCLSIDGLVQGSITSCASLLPGSTTSSSRLSSPHSLLPSTLHRPLLRLATSRSPSTAKNRDYYTSNMTRKLFTVLENNPQVMDHLARDLGLDDALSFYDIYSLTDPDLLALIPRPVFALLVIIPLTPTWYEARTAEDKDKPEYEGKGDCEPVIWFKQTIGNACGSIGLVHCLLNSEASKHIRPSSVLDRIRNDAVPKPMWERAKVLEDSTEFERAHAEAASLGDTVTPTPISGEHTGQHFVAFVKGRDGHLWELEGARMGPLDRGALENDEDVLSPAALDKGLGRLMRIESEKGGDLRFSAIALASSLD